MPAELEFVDHALVHLDDLSFMWVDVKRFSIRNVEASDVLLLAALIDSPEYRDHYAGGAFPNAENLHGPYWLGSISPAMFQPVSRDDVVGQIQTWADDPEPQSYPTQQRLQSEVFPLVDSGALYMLRDLRAHAEHDWGWVVGSGGFYEIVAIDREAKSLTLLVASDD